MTKPKKDYQLKENWGPGPWESEPDDLRFEYRGRQCLIIRGPVGSFCGYTALDPGHPYYQKGYDSMDISVHGGLTFAGPTVPGIIDFAPNPIKYGDPWVVGFDCAHGGDLAPAVDSMGARSMLGLSKFSSHLGIYRDLDYVQAQLKSVVDQLIALETGGKEE